MSGANERAFFEAAAASYGSLYDPATRAGTAELFRIRREVAAELARGERGPLLECASGTGEVTEAVSAAAGIESGLVNDLSPAMLAACRARLDRAGSPAAIAWHNEDVFKLLAGLEPGRFGLVLCLGLLAHVGRASELFGLLHRVTAPGGAVLLQASVLEHPGVRVLDVVVRSWPARFPHRVVQYRLAELLSLAKPVGLEAVTVRRYGLCLPFADRWAGPVNYHLERLFARKLTAVGGEAVVKFRRCR